MLNFLRRRRIKKIIGKLSPQLVKGFGSREYFTLAQIYHLSQSLAQRHKLIAVALFCDPNTLEEPTRDSVLAIRVRIKEDFFGGETYTADDVLRLAKQHKWKGGQMDDYMSHHHGMGSRY
ncbi:hypothetical protein F0267_08720 [Vibrio coralliilyticus]|uniref:Uncharacterized protein n=1 Tax=Vibrio coralliilyticus TaxID=190893 RepID=A0AAN0SLE7_9VIBR|nr:DUF6559 family protein [Vibrio coralliilyticus]AIW22922.1 hypothetical protein IX92_28235 [Vibrio coralliilyticus]NOH38314.1 hypothetical protein [Vibrio coralliilyticus]NOH54958.1 hypothetical protein [Vibrio coralliilyticus]